MHPPTVTLTYFLIMATRLRSCTGASYRLMRSQHSRPQSLQMRSKSATDPMVEFSASCSSHSTQLPPLPLHHTPDTHKKSAPVLATQPRLQPRVHLQLLQYLCIPILLHINLHNGNVLCMLCVTQGIQNNVETNLFLYSSSTCH